MAAGDNNSWWRRTSRLTLFVMVFGATLSLGALALAPALDARAIAGIPNGMFTTVLLVPIVILLLIFWSGERQRRIDRRPGNFEDYGSETK